MRTWLVAAVAVFAAVGAGARTPESESGKELYGRYCASCHGVDAKGGEAAKETVAAPPDLTRIASSGAEWFPDALVRDVVDGRYHTDVEREMPVWGAALTQGEIASIVEYLRSLQEGGPR